jgi:hypothetical protein
MITTFFIGVGLAVGLGACQFLGSDLPPPPSGPYAPVSEGPEHRVLVLETTTTLRGSERAARCGVYRGRLVPVEHLELCPRSGLIMMHRAP